MILLTGMSGLVGETIARSLSASNTPVVGTFLTHPIVVPRVDAIPSDLTDAAAVRRLIDAVRPKAIIHCAAATKTDWCDANPQDARAAIVGATANLATAAGDLPFIHFSTDLVFDGNAAPYTEDAPPQPLNLYGKLKAESEDFVKDLPLGMVLRSSLIYAPPATHSNSFLNWMVQSLVYKKPLTLFRDEYRTPVFVDDLAMAVGLLLANPAGGIYHAGGPDRLSRLEMGEILCRTFSLPSQSIVAANREDVPSAALRARDVSLSCQRLHQLGWRPVSFSNGLNTCLERWNSSSATP